MKKTLKLLALLMSVFMLVSLTVGCGQKKEKHKIGLLMPSKKTSRWTQDADNLIKQLQSKDFKIVTKNADDDADLQVTQLSELIDEGCEILVIASIDSDKLTALLEKAASKKIRIIAYDRLIMNTKNVDYYVTFDNYEVGKMQGTHIETALGLDKGNGPFNIELFGGAPEDNNARFFFNGAMDVLNKYIESGMLVVKSGQKNFEEISTEAWLNTNAENRMAELLKTYYNGDALHAVLSPNDSLAGGILNALKADGYDGVNRNFPVIVGQDADIDGVKAILRGEQSMTIFKDTRELANATFKIIDNIFLGKSIETNGTYDNNIKTVPTYSCKPFAVTADNYKAYLVDSGYYDADAFAEFN